MENYIEFVEKLASEKKDEIFFNSGPSHAAIVMSRIFRYAQKTIKIMCGGFNGSVSNDEEYLKYLDSYLLKGGKLQILVEQNLSKGESKIFNILKKYKNNIEIYQTNYRVQMNDRPIHFAVGDNQMLRIETGTDDYSAQVNFGNTKDANKFIGIFDDIFSKSKEKPIIL